MYTEDSPLERTPDLIAKIRALREQAEKQMEQFTHADDYDIRCVIGRKPTAEPSPTINPKKKLGKKTTDQTSMDFASAPAEHNTGNRGQA
jgi:hypothetical protein